jgi:hypothetical protein
VEEELILILIEFYSSSSAMTGVLACTKGICHAMPLHAAQAKQPLTPTLMLF